MDAATRPRSVRVDPPSVMNELSALGRDINGLVDESAARAYRNAAGKAGKDAAAEVARRDLGGDMAMSGMRRRAKLSSRYELTPNGVTLNLTPAGLWTLADKGRRHAKRVQPRRRGAKALNTPWGPKASTRGSTSRGLNTISDAERQIATDAFDAVDKAVTERITRF